MLAQLLAVMAPVLLSIGVGYLWTRRGGEFDTRVVTAVVMYVGTPSLLLSTFNQARPSAAAFAEMAAGALLVALGTALLAAAVLRLFRLSLRDFLPALVFPNMGNMGLPICLFAFGEEGLALAIVLFTVNVIGHFTFGMGIARGRADLRGLARLPLIYAVALGLLLVFADLRLPLWIGNTLNLLGGLTIPLMLLALGVSLGRIGSRGLGRSIGLAALRLGGGFAVAFGVSTVFGLEGAARGVLLLQCSMPVAVYSYLFAERFGRAGAEVAGMVVASTMLSFATLPLLLWYLLGTAV